MGMGMVTRTVERETREPRMDSGIYQPPIRGFMDDLTVTTTTTHKQARWVLSALEDSVSWARMKYKAKKSRCLVLWKGRVDRRVKMQIQGEEIQSIVGNTIKCLGKWFNKSITDKESIEDTKKLLSWLRTQLMAVDYLESTRHGSTSMGSYQDLCGCSSFMIL